MTASLGSYYFSSLFYQLTPSFSNWGDIGPSRPYWVRVLFFRTWPPSDCTKGVALLRSLKSMDDDFVRPLGRAEYCARCCTWTTYLNTLIVLLPRSSCLDDLVTWALPLWWEEDDLRIILFLSISILKHCNGRVTPEFFLFLLFLFSFFPQCCADWLHHSSQIQCQYRSLERRRLKTTFYV